MGSSITRTQGDGEKPVCHDAVWEISPDCVEDGCFNLCTLIAPCTTGVQAHPGGAKPAVPHTHTPRVHSNHTYYVSDAMYMCSIFYPLILESDIVCVYAIHRWEGGIHSIITNMIQVMTRNVILEFHFFIVDGLIV